MSLVINPVGEKSLMVPQTTKQLVTVLNENGLHARPATLIAKTASEFASDITLERNGQVVNAKSVISILILAASKGTTLTLRACGEDRESAVAAVSELFRQRFNEV